MGRTKRRAGIILHVVMKPIVKLSLEGFKNAKLS